MSDSNPPKVASENTLRGQLHLYLVRLRTDATAYADGLWTGEQLDADFNFIEERLAEMVGKTNLDEGAK